MNPKASQLTSLARRQTQWASWQEAGRLKPCPIRTLFYKFPELPVLDSVVLALLWPKTVQMLSKGNCQAMNTIPGGLKQGLHSVDCHHSQCMPWCLLVQQGVMQGCRMALLVQRPVYSLRAIQCAGPCTGILPSPLI